VTEVLRPSLVTLWGVLGFVALLANAVRRLVPYAIEAIEMGMTTGQWIAYVGYGVFMAYTEGYRGFHRQASPRVVARGVYLANRPTVLRVVLAPLFCMALFAATPRRLIVRWALLLVIVGLIVLVRMLEQPWRGIVDVGVVIGLAMGAVSTLYFLIRAYLGAPPELDPEVPNSGPKS